jgi:hypothetical protein
MIEQGVEFVVYIVIGSAVLVFLLRMWKSWKQ